MCTYISINSVTFFHPLLKICQFKRPISIKYQHSIQAESHFLRYEYVCTRTVYTRSTYRRESQKALSDFSKCPSSSSFCQIILFIAIMQEQQQPKRAFIGCSFLEIFGMCLAGSVYTPATRFHTIEDSAGGKSLRQHQP